LGDSFEGLGESFDDLDDLAESFAELELSEDPEAPVDEEGGVVAPSVPDLASLLDEDLSADSLLTAFFRASDG
jgi:hypothetical protein